MRKCIDLESQPGFQSIYAPQMQQAIDRGLAGHSGTGVVDWGYEPVGPDTKPGRKAKTKPVGKLPPTPPVDPKVVNPVVTGSDTYFDYLFNTYGTPEMRALINKYPKVKITAYNGGGYFSPGEGQYGTVYTSKGLEGDVSTLFHEYGHALDNIIGIDLHKDTDSMGTSKFFIDEFVKDGTNMGMIIDDSIYWDYLSKNGINFPITTRRMFNLNKGSDRRDIEKNMQPGDHWRIMEELLRITKEKARKVKNVKNPDPVKVKRAEDDYKKMNALYDNHLKRIKAVKDIRKLVMASPLAKYQGDKAAIYRQRGAIGDIIDALTSGEIYDWEVVTRERIMLGGHGFGYYNMRKTSSGVNRNRSMDGSMFFRKAEIWAQFFQFLIHQDNTSANIMKKLMPNTDKKFQQLIKEAQTAKLQVAEAFNSPEFNPDLPILS